MFIIDIIIGLLSVAIIVSIAIVISISLTPTKENFVECFYNDRGVFFVRFGRSFNKEIYCETINVHGTKLSKMKLTGKCDLIDFCDVENYNEVDLSGFMELEIGIFVSRNRKGLLNVLELKCERFMSNEKKLDEIMNKYLEEKDPLMRDIQGCKYELAVNGYGDRL